MDRRGRKPVRYEQCYVGLTASIQLQIATGVGLYSRPVKQLYMHGSTSVALVLLFRAAFGEQLYTRKRNKNWRIHRLVVYSPFNSVSNLGLVY